MAFQGYLTGDGSSNSMSRSERSPTPSSGMGENVGSLTSSADLSARNVRVEVGRELVTARRERSEKLNECFILVALQYCLII